MDEQIKRLAFNYHERITHILMLESLFLNDLGLMTGQMGIVLALSKYSKFNCYGVLDDFASELLDRIINNLHKKLPYSFENGLAGIGWGIEYLLQNQYMEGDGTQICENIDLKIMETDPKRIVDLSLETGIEGLLHYIIFHLHGAIKQGSKLPFDETYLRDIFYVCRKLKGKCVSKNLKYLQNMYIYFYKTRKVENYNFEILEFSGLLEKLPKNLIIHPLGIKHGLAGILLAYNEK